MMMNSLDTLSKHAETIRKSVWDTFNWDLFLGTSVEGTIQENKKKVNMQILNEENQDIEFLWQNYEEESADDEPVEDAAEDDEPEYEEVSLPEDENDFEHISITDDIHDEEEYYSDYGEETDEELQRDLPDATG